MKLQGNAKMCSNFETYRFRWKQAGGVNKIIVDSFKAKSIEDIRFQLFFPGI